MNAIVSIFFTLVIVATLTACGGGNLAKAPLGFYDQADAEQQQAKEEADSSDLSCNTTGDCQAGEVCKGNLCVAENGHKSCEKNSDCEPGFGCSRELRVCVSDSSVVENSDTGSVNGDTGSNLGVADAGNQHQDTSNSNPDTGITDTNPTDTNVEPDTDTDTSNTADTNVEPDLPVETDTDTDTSNTADTDVDDVVEDTGSDDAGTVEDTDLANTDVDDTDTEDDVVEDAGSDDTDIDDSGSFPDPDTDDSNTTCGGRVICAEGNYLCVTSVNFTQGEVFRLADAFFIGDGQPSEDLSQDYLIGPNQDGYYCIDTSNWSVGDHPFTLISELNDAGTLSVDGGTWVWWQNYDFCKLHPLGAITCVERSPGNYYLWVNIDQDGTPNWQ